MFFLYRRLIYAAAVSLLQFSIVLQVLVSISVSLFMLCYFVVWKPMESKVYNFLAIFNEALLLVMFYLSLLFTDYVGDPELRYKFGAHFLNLMYANVAVNGLFILRELYRLLHQDCKRNRARKKQR